MRDWQHASTVTPIDPIELAAILEEVRRAVQAVDEDTGVHRPLRKPLIIMTPKSILRHKRATSSLAEMGDGTTFHRILWDDAESLPNERIKLAKDDKIRRVARTVLRMIDGLQADKLDL